METLQKETTSEVILPFDKEGEYFVENLGEIEPKPIYDFFKS